MDEIYDVKRQIQDTGDTSQMQGKGEKYGNNQTQGKGEKYANSETKGKGEIQTKVRYYLP